MKWVWLLDCNSLKAPTTSFPPGIPSSPWGMTHNGFFLNIWLTEFSVSPSITTRSSLMIVSNFRDGAPCFLQTLYPGWWDHRDLMQWRWKLSAVSLPFLFEQYFHVTIVTPGTRMLFKWKWGGGGDHKWCSSQKNLPRGQPLWQSAKLVLVPFYNKCI